MSRIRPANIRQTSKTLNYGLIATSPYYYGSQLKKTLALQVAIKSLGDTLFFPTGPVKRNKLQTLQPTVLPVFSQLRFQKLVRLQLAKSPHWFVSKTLFCAHLISNGPTADFFDGLKPLIDSTSNGSNGTDELENIKSIKQVLNQVDPRKQITHRFVHTIKLILQGVGGPVGTDTCLPVNVLQQNFNHPNIVMKKTMHEKQREPADGFLGYKEQLKKNTFVLAPRASIAYEKLLDLKNNKKLRNKKRSLRNKKLSNKKLPIAIHKLEKVEKNKPQWDLKPQWDDFLMLLKPNKKDEHFVFSNTSMFEEPTALCFAIAQTLTKKIYDFASNSLKALPGKSLQKPKSLKENRKNTVFYDYKFLEELLQPFGQRQANEDNSVYQWALQPFVHASHLNLKKTVQKDPWEIVWGSVNDDSVEENLMGLKVIKQLRPKGKDISQVESYSQSSLTPKFAAICRFNRPMKLHLFGFLLGRYPLTIGQKMLKNSQTLGLKKMTLQQADHFESNAVKQSFGVARLKTAIIFPFDFELQNHEKKTLRPTFSIRL